MISRPAKLRREHYSLAIEQEETAFVPFEDIAVIVLNHREITLTHPVLSACAEYGIGLYATGSNHQPSGVFLPFLSHSRTTRMMRKQLDIARPIAKQAWASVVHSKIENQAICLKLCGKEGVERMESYARRIRSGDPDNLEGQAAAFYFPQLFGAGFHRAAEQWINSALDYGYAVLRGAITRGLVAHGLHPTIGLFHASEQNAFNLADDLIEPFRPLVDLHVAKRHTAAEGELSTEDKQALVALLNIDVGMPQGKMSVLSAVEYAAESLVRTYETEQATLELPTLIGLQPHQLEY
ncbi:type II CRISPR-associated endonuclease Cas1 [Bordetella sp. FB-8]|uniref:type II CRISPR-associated endonuclease Cas1 n=1 Tax=Bordetella sp. FB-8 TaxID=1159870 RepID=UPI00037841F5|nr:type II CRISPR-associated endonuclease Cas1 [Bordetella sp. FB-8]